MTDIRVPFADVKPFHRKPVGLRFGMETNFGTPFQAAYSVLRVHGDLEQTSTFVAALVVVGFALDGVDIAECSPRHGCLNSLWHGPASLTDEQLEAALQIIRDNA